MKKTVSFFLALLPLTVYGDLTITKTTSNGVETEYYKKGKFASVSSQQTQIVDFVTKTITLIQKSQKKYTVVTFDEMKKQADQLKQAMQNQAKQSGIDQSQIDAMLHPKQSDPKKIGKGNIAGYSCEKYETQMDQGPMRTTTESCESKTILETIKQLIPQANQLGSFMGSEDKEIVESFGYPLSTITKESMIAEGQTMPMGEEEREVVKKIDESAISDTLFEIPKTYTKVPLMEMMGQD